MALGQIIRAIFGSIVLSAGPLVDLFGAEVFFTEDFSTSAQNPNLETYAPSFQISGGNLIRTPPSDNNDARYMRTIVSDYNTRNFIFELTFTTMNGNWGNSTMIGIGEANRDTAYHLPGNSVCLRMYPTTIIEGAVVVRTVLGQEIPIGRTYSGGPHRARIEKIGTSITFSVDEKYNGTFKADVSVTFVNLAEIGPFLNDRNSNLFFGSVAAESFDDLSISSPDTPSADCNGNDVEDSMDISEGTSMDGNGDGIPDDCQISEHYFEDRFERAVVNPSLEGYGPFFCVQDGIIRRTGMTSQDDRRYMRTVETDYNFRDFVFEITFTTKDGMVFIGIGEGVPGGAYNEPKNSINFRAHPLSLADGGVGIATPGGEVSLGQLKTSGPHRARIEKKEGKIIFFLDDVFDGTFKADMTKTFDFTAIASGFNDRSSHLFFGCGNPEEIFDDLKIFLPDIEGPDCNNNYVLDSVDIARGTSKDENRDGIPDECLPIPGTIQIEDAGGGIARVLLENQIPVKGGEISIAFDPDVVQVAGVARGVDLSAESELRFNLSPDNLCEPSVGVRAGLTIGWINPVPMNTPPGTHEILLLSFGPSKSLLEDDCSPLWFVRCLGVPDFPVQNIVTDSTGQSRLLVAVDGKACVKALPAFHRGDANGDGTVDISDAIGLLTCLFLGGLCPPCQDMGDLNDDGRFDVTDPIYLLAWRFLGGPAPAVPFPGCGIDLSEDTLTCFWAPPCR